jgi:hypothetical protein
MKAQKTYLQVYADFKEGMGDERPAFKWDKPDQTKEGTRNLQQC